MRQLATATPIHGPAKRRAPQSVAAGTGRNLTIEGLRGFSASLVVAYHIHNMAITGGFFHPHHGPLVGSLIKDSGRFGVLLFFMVSGYLIVQSLLRYDSVPRFLKHRVWRIYPVFVLFHLVMFTLGPWRDYAWMSALKQSASAYALHFVSNLLLLPGMFPLPIAQKNAWSLSDEFAFYLISSLFFCAAARPARRSLRLLALLAGVAGAVVTLFCHPFTAYFLTGVVVFLAGRVMGRGTTPRVPALAGTLLLGLAFLAHAEDWSWTALILSVPFFFTVVQQAGWFARFLRTPPLLYLGRISYSLYLVHPFVLETIRQIVVPLALRVHGEVLGLTLFGVLGAAGAVVAAGVLYRRVEVGFTNRFLRDERPAPGFPGRGIVPLLRLVPEEARSIRPAVAWRSTRT